jgi:hypothetical protein
MKKLLGSLVLATGLAACSAPADASMIDYCYDQEAIDIIHSQLFGEIGLTMGIGYDAGVVLGTTVSGQFSDIEANQSINYVVMCSATFSLEDSDSMELLWSIVDEDDGVVVQLLAAE